MYGNLKLGNFEEEVSGVNLSKLFSVYGPQSAEGKRKKKARAPEVGVEPLPRHFESRSRVTGETGGTKKQLNAAVVPIRYG